MATDCKEQAVSAYRKSFLSEVSALDRYRLTNEFTRALDALSQKFGVQILDGKVEPIDMEWNGPDAEKWEQYALNEDNQLVRGFWNQHRVVVSR